MGTEKERRDTRAALLYELRSTKEELCDWFDTIADAKDQD